jgi:hypothetical protein
MSPTPTASATENQIPGTTEQPEMDRVIHQLANFQVVSNSFTRFVFSSLPVLIVVLLLADWLIGSKAFAGDMIRLTGLLTIALMCVLANYLFSQVPAAFSIVWQRNLILSAKDRQPVAEAFYSYLQQFEFFLNRRLAWLVGVAGALLGLSVTYPVRFWFVSQPHLLPPGWLSYYLWGSAGIVAVPLGFLVGLMVWRVAVIAVFVSKLGADFDLKMQPNHPDQSGGLKPLGDLCFTIAFLLLAPAIYLSVWGFVAAFFHVQEDSILLIWSVVFRQWLVALSVGALFVFFQPLYSIHRQMVKSSRAVLAELDGLSQQIEELSLELRTQAAELTPSQGNEKLEAIDLLNKIYQHNSQVPTWPFNSKTLIRFSAGQAVPVLSLVVTSKPILDLVGSLVSPLVK